MVVRITVALCLLASIARADIESELVQKGVAAYNDLEYPKAIDLLNKALKETLTREERVATYRTLAFSHVALGDIDKARGDFENLLRTDPKSSLDRSASPKVRGLFEEAKGKLATGVIKPEVGKTLAELTPELRPAAPKEGEALVVDVYHPGGIAVTLQLFYRTRGTANFSKVSGEGSLGRFSVTIPGMAIEAPGIEYYVEALDDNGAPIAAAGSLASPILLDIAARGKPVYKRGVFWGVLGGVLVAGAIAGVVSFLVLRPGPNTPATVTIVPQ
jgi:tetratricopeptide (TPR) repeat protein